MARLSKEDPFCLKEIAIGGDEPTLASTAAFEKRRRKREEKTVPTQEISDVEYLHVDQPGRPPVDYMSAPEGLWKDSSQNKEDLKEPIIADFDSFMLGIFSGALGAAILCLSIYALLH